MTCPYHPRVSLAMRQVKVSPAPRGVATARAVPVAGAPIGRKIEPAIPAGQVEPRSADQMEGPEPSTEQRQGIDSQAAP